MVKGELKKATKKVRALKKRAAPIERFEQLHEVNKGSLHNDDLVGLKPWHMDLIEDRIVNGMEYLELGQKYDCTREWAAIVCKSDAGVKYAKLIIEQFDIQAVRKTFQMLTAPATQVIRKVIMGRFDGIDELDRAKLCLDVIKAGGVAAPKEHKITFEGLFKEAGDRLTENEKMLQAQAQKDAVTDVIEGEILQIVHDDGVADGD